MDSPADNVIPLFTPSRCPHDWQPVQGWQARYQCTLCGALGRKRRVLTLHRRGGPLGNPGVTAYRCRFRVDGVRCPSRAVVRAEGKIRCAIHGGGEHTRGARETLGSHDR